MLADTPLAASAPLLQIKRLRLALSILLPVGAMLFSIFFFGVRYRSSDDAVICAIASGAFGDSVHLVFSNVTLGYIIRILNLICAANWYFILELVLIAVSLCALCHIFMRRRGIFSGAAWMLVLLAAFSTNVFYYVQFTVTGFVLTACGLLLIADHLGERSCATVLGVALVWFGSLFRFSCFLAGGALSAFLLLHRFFSLSDRKQKRTAVFTMLILFTLVFASFAADKLAYTAPEWKAYTEYNSVRAYFSDYATNFLAGKNNPFIQHGIYPEEQAMLDNWNFYDPAYFTTELLSDLSATALGFNNLTLFGAPSLLVRQLLAFSSQHSLLFAAVLILLVLHIRKNRATLTAVATVVMLTALLAVLAVKYNGRLTPWVEVGLVFCFTSNIVFLMPQMWERCSRFWPLPLLLCAGLVFFGWQDYSDYHNYTDDALAARAEQYAHFEEMALDDENLYLISTLPCDSMFNADVWNPAGSGQYENIVLMGSWMSGHPDQVAALERFGLTRPVVDGVDNPNVYYDYHDIAETAAYASRQLGCEVIAVDTGKNAYCPYQLVSVQPTKSES